MQQQIIKVGCYVRVSTENQIENYSIDEQIERLKAFCFAKKWSISKFYTDGGYSGGNLERPALKQLLQDIKNKQLNMVVVYKLDRLSRSQKDTLTLIEDEFLKNNVDFVSMNENFDTSTPFGRAMIGILSVFAQLEKDQITERFTMGRIGRSKAGYYHGGSTAPTGYNYINGLLEINQIEAAQVREVFQKFLNGMSINSIQKYINDKYKKQASHTHMINILRNTVYIGRVKFKNKEYDGVHEPLIDKEVFYAAQNLLNSSDRANKKTTAQKTPFRAGYTLSSLIYCEHCGARYSANHGYYKCYSRSKSSKEFIKDKNCKNKNWRVFDLDNLVMEQIKKIIYDEVYFNDAIKISSEKHIDLKAVNDKIKKIDSQISKVIDLYQISSIPMDEVSLRVTNLQNEKKALSDLLVKSESDNTTFIEIIKNARSEIDNVFLNSTTEEKRLFISSLIERVLIDEDKVTVKWRF